MRRVHGVRDVCVVGCVRVSEAEETRRDHERRLALLRVRCSYLEEENRSLSEHVVSLRTRVNVLAAADARAAADGRPAADNVSGAARKKY